MADYSFNINSDEVVIHANRLEQISKSAFPVSIRTVLNKAAFDVKTKTMPMQAKNAFINRSQNFFKANSRVEQAQGFKVEGMKATIGFTETSLKGDHNYAVKDLEQQERGGTIRKRAFIPTEKARGGSHSKLVKPGNRLSRINKVVDVSKAKGKNEKEKFIKSVLYAGKGGYVLAQRNGKSVLWRVNSLNRTAAGSFKLTELYSYKKGRNIRINKETAFMRKASLASAAKMNNWFKEQAELQVFKNAKKSFLG